METALRSYLSDLKWRLRLVENQIMTAQKLEYKAQIALLMELKENFEWTIFKIEAILDENGSK